MSSHTDKQCRKQKRGNDAARIAIHQGEYDEWSNEQSNDNYHSFLLHFHETQNKDLEEPDDYPEELQTKIVKAPEKASETKYKSKVLPCKETENTTKMKVEVSVQPIEIVEVIEIIEIVEIIEEVQYERIQVERDDITENTDAILQIKADEAEPSEKLLVDSGASANIVRDASKFVEFQEDFKPDKHSVTLANGDIEKVAEKRGTILIHLRDEAGVIRDVYLGDTLYCPSYPQDIFSVKSALKDGGKVVLNSDDGELIMGDGSKFPIGSTDGMYKLDLFEKPKFVYDTNKVNKSDVTKHEMTIEDMTTTPKKDFSCKTCTQHHFVREKYADGQRSRSIHQTIIETIAQDI